MDVHNYIVFDILSKKPLRRFKMSRDVALANVNAGEDLIQVDESISEVGMLIDNGNLIPDPNYVSSDPTSADIQRGERNSMLMYTAWTQMPDAALTTECREAYRLWRVALNRHLVDYPDGLTPLPEEPVQVFTPLEEQV